MYKVDFPKQRPMAIGFMHKDEVLSQVELEELPEDVGEDEELEDPEETESVNDF